MICLESKTSGTITSVPRFLQEKASRIDRIVTEHQMFAQGLKELQNWVTDTSHMLQTYCAPTADKNVLDSRMIKLEVMSNCQWCGGKHLGIRCWVNPP